MTALPPVLTGRMSQVLLLIAEGKSDKEIGEELFVSVSTAKKAAECIYGKLGAVSRANAVHLGHRAGWLGAAELTPQQRYVLLQQLLIDPEVATLMVAERGARTAVSLP